MAVKVICHALNTRGISETDYFALSEGRLDLRQVRTRFHLLFVILYVNVKEEITFSVLKADRGNHLTFMTFSDGDVLHITGVKTSFGQARDTFRCLAIAVRHPSKVCSSKEYPRVTGARHKKREKIKTYFTPVAPVLLPPLFSSSTTHSLDTSSAEPKVQAASTASPLKYRVPPTSPQSNLMLPKGKGFNSSSQYECSDCSSDDDDCTSPKPFLVCPPTRFNTPFTSPEFLDPYYDYYN